MDVLLSASCGASSRRRRHRPRDAPPRLKSCGPDQGHPLRTMGLTAAAVEISGGEVGDLVAEHLEKHRERRHGKLCGQANDAALEMDPPQRPAKPLAPFDPDCLLKVLEPPAARAVPQQTPDVLLKRSTADRHHAQDASTFCVSRGRDHVAGGGQK